MLQASVIAAVESGAQLAGLGGSNFGQGFPGGFNAYDERLASDLDLAMAVQRQMLPRDTKQLSTVKYAGLSAAARRVGGDYYDFLDLGPGSLGFVLSDASGKGIAAALLMANLQASIRAECAHGVCDL